MGKTSGATKTIWVPIPVPYQFLTCPLPCLASLGHPFSHLSHLVPPPNLKKGWGQTLYLISAHTPSLTYIHLTVWSPILSHPGLSGFPNGTGAAPQLLVILKSQGLDLEIASIISIFLYFQKILFSYFQKILLEVDSSERASAMLAIIVKLLVIACSYPRLNMVWGWNCARSRH